MQPTAYAVASSEIKGSWQGSALELQVKPQARHQHGSAIAVISGMVDVLQIEGAEEAAPYVEVVIRFDDVLPPVVQSTIAQPGQVDRAVHGGLETPPKK